MIKRVFIIPIFAGIALSSSGLCAAEKTVSGIVRLDGPRPKRQPIQLTPGIRELYQTHPLSEVKIVSAKGEVANVFVYVKKGLPEAKTFPVPEKSALVNQKKSMFRPRVQGVFVGQEVILRNSDPLIHNVRSLSDENRPFNIGQPAGTPDRKKVFKDKEGPIELRCDFHPWMRAYLFVMDHPFFAVTDRHGHFIIKNLPAGEYTLAIWHEAFGEQKQKITVGANGLKDVTFTYQPGTVNQQHK